MGMRIVGARHPVEQGDVAEPGARLDVGEGDLLARERDRAHAHRAERAADPLLRFRAARPEDRPVGEPAHDRARQDRFAQGLGEFGEPRTRFDVRLFLDCENRRMHVQSLT
jgi:hypothetical protein